MTDVPIESWRWQLNRQIAEYLNLPSKEQAQHIQALLDVYREFYQAYEDVRANLDEAG